jgi:hypothetical protein
VTHVPDQTVAPEVEHSVQSYRQLDNAQVGPQVTTGVLNALQEEAPQLIAQPGQLLGL